MKQTVARTDPLTAEPCEYRANSAAPKVLVRLFENKVPDYARVTLDANSVESLDWPQARRKHRAAKPRLSTYAVLQDGKPSVVFVFQRDKEKVTVLNAPEVLNGTEASRFARYIFTRFSMVDKVCFRYRETLIQQVAFAGRNGVKSGAAAVSLPRRMSEHMENATRFTPHNIKYFLNRVKRDYPSFSYEKYENGSISSQLCQDILNLNRLRMIERNRTTGGNDDRADKLISAVRASGLVGIIRINGKLCAGTICYRIGSKYHLRVLSHDPQYNAYGLGNLCCYLTVCECMDQAGDKTVATGGATRFRYRLARKQYAFDALVIHRPRATLLVRCDVALYLACTGFVRRVRTAFYTFNRLVSLLLRLPLMGRKLLHALKERHIRFAW